MDIVFWSITLVVSAVILYLMGYITGYNRAVNEDEYQRMKERAEEASKRGELL